MSFAHTPVLVPQVLDLLTPTGARRLVDGTVGGGGHAAALLAALPQAELLGLDRDDEALAAAGARLAPFGTRVRLVHADFAELTERLGQAGWDEVDAVLLDLGVSSHQLDTPARGFAHRLDGPLDMRMDRRSPLTAAVLLNESSERELQMIFHDYGEEPRSRAIARAVVARRAEHPWESTGELAALIAAVAGRAADRGLPVATRCFQALRIAVNRELDALAEGLTAAIDCLRPGGRVAVISFHSLEDRLVKHRFREEATACLCPPKLPVCRCGHRARLRLLTRHPLRAGAEERALTPRAAPARLRAAEKLPAVEAAGAPTMTGPRLPPGVPDTRGTR